METTREDFIDGQRTRINGLKKRLDELLSAERKADGEDTARRDKPLQDARDLVRLALQQLADLDGGSDEAYARDREGLTHTVSQLQQVVEGASKRPAERGVPPDARRSPPIH